MTDEQRAIAEQITDAADAEDDFDPADEPAQAPWFFYVLAAIAVLVAIATVLA